MDKHSVAISPPKKILLFTIFVDFFSLQLQTDFKEEAVDPPDANNDFYSTPEDTRLENNVLNNDNDNECDTDIGLTVSLVNGTANGVLDPLYADGEFVYEPDLNFAGKDSFVYQVTDCKGSTATATGK